MPTGMSKWPKERRAAWLKQKKREAAAAQLMRYHTIPEHRDYRRNYQALLRGYAPPPPERDCPPRPSDGQCQRCHEIAASHMRKPAGMTSLVMDHDHETGAFRGWVCTGCNGRVERVNDELTRAYLTGAA